MNDKDLGNLKRGEILTELHRVPEEEAIGKDYLDQAAQLLATGLQQHERISMEYHVGDITVHVHRPTL